MKKTDIPFLSATDLAPLLENKKVSPVEATQAYLDRIDDVDFKFNSYLTVSRGEALQAARDAEQAIMHGGYLGPMHGIPVAVKDQIWSKGIRTTGGSRFLGDFLPGVDATVVVNLKNAGAVLLGKLNMTEFAMSRSAHRYSLPHNPWDLDRETGGSSSGSGAATSAYLCASSLGEGYRGLHSGASSLLWRGRFAAQLRQGQPLWCVGSGLVYGHHRPNHPDRRGRSDHARRHCGTQTPKIRIPGMCQYPTSEKL